MNRSRRISRSSTLLVPLLMGCGDAGASDSGHVVRDSAGIEIVENDHTSPAWSPDRAWTLSDEPVIRIGTIGGDSTQQLHRVVDSHRLSDGRIAVANTGSAEVRIYDGRGRYLESIGRSGDGPGEFRAPWMIQQIPGDSLVVVDLNRHISVFDPAGDFVRRFLPPRPGGQVFGEGFEPVDAFGDGTLLFRSHLRGEYEIVDGLRRNRIAMIRVGLDGSTTTSLGEFDDQTSRVTPTGSPGRYMFGAWAKEAASDSTMWYGPGDRFEIREIDWSGRTIRLLRLDRPTEPVTEAAIASYRERSLESARGTPREEAVRRMVEETEFAPEFPPHFELLTDAEGNLWVQDYRPWWEPVDRTWTVFDPGGRFLGTAVVPAALTVDEIGSDYVLGRETDELDVEYVVQYDLQKPGG